MLITFFEHRHHRFDRFANNMLQFDRGSTEFNLPFGDAGNIKQIIEKRRHLAGLAIDRSKGLLQQF